MPGGLSEQSVRDTQRFWVKRTGQHVSDEDAREAVRNLGALFDLLAQWERASPTEEDTTDTPVRTTGEGTARSGDKDEEPAAPDSREPE